MKFILVTVLLLHMVLSHFNIEAANFYCKNGTSVQLGIDIEVGQNENIIPALDRKHYQSHGINCKWELIVTKVPTVTIVLTGFHTKKRTPRRWARFINHVHQETAKLHYRLQGSEKSDKCSSDAMEEQHVDTVDTTFFRVLNMQKGSKLSITYEQTSNADDAQSMPPGLKVQVMEKGFCSRDIVNYNQNCYKISPVQKTLKAELSDINGDSKVVRLASFDSLDALHKFVETSQLRLHGTGYNTIRKIPLNLTLPVRFGWFFNKQTGLISYLRAIGNECRLEHLSIYATNLKFTDLSSNSTHAACGSLRVEQGREIVEFRSCNEQLPALISFADTPRNECSNCTEPVARWIEDMNQKSGEIYPGIGGMNSKTMAMLAGCIIASTIVICAVVVLVLRVKQRKISINYLHVKVKDAADAEQRPEQ